MLEKSDKKQNMIIAIAAIAVLFVMFLSLIVISTSGSKKSNTKIEEIYLKAAVVGENRINLEVETQKNKMTNYVIEKSSTLDFEQKEEVKGSTNTEKVEIDTEGIEETTYYRVKMENIETKEVTYSNVISVSPKEEEENGGEKEYEIDNEIEIEERKDEKSKSKTKEEIEVEEIQSSSSEIEEETSYSSESEEIDNTDNEESNTNIEENEDQYEEEYEESRYSTSKSVKKSSVKSSTKSSSKKENTEEIEYEENTYINEDEEEEYNYYQNTEKKSEEKVVEVRSIKISATNIELDISGKNTRTLGVTVNPENATNKEVIWETEDEKIVKVDEKGTITGISNGQTNIVAKVGKKQAKCRVKVITTATGIKIEKQKLELDITTNKQAQITAEVEPKTATNSKITWTSEDTKIARVDSKGMVTGISNGKTKIKANGMRFRKIYQKIGKE